MEYITVLQASNKSTSRLIKSDRIVKVANMETAKELANCAPPEGKTWSLFLKVTNKQTNNR